MIRKFLITGATDGIGLETAKMLLEKGHHVLLHGRNSEKLQKVETELSQIGKVESYTADLSNFDDVKTLAKTISENHNHLDILINNAGVFKTSNPITQDGFDVRFMVNTIAPYLLTQKLLPLFPKNGRIINLSSAAQSSVNLDALSAKNGALNDMDAYSQSKLAITMWSRVMANTIDQIMIAVNPGSLLASKMVKEGFGIPGNDLSIGAKIIARLSLDDEFTDKSGQYFDNDNGSFSHPHPDGLDDGKCQDVVQIIETIISSQNK